MCIRDSREEVRKLSGVDARLAHGPTGEQLAAGAVEAAVQLGEEPERVRAQDLLVTPLDGRAKLHPSRDLGSHGPRLVAIVVAVARVRAVALDQLGRAEDDDRPFPARRLTTVVALVFPGVYRRAAHCLI